MKIYVSADMEGIAGIMLREQLFRGEPLYQEARQLLTKEVNVIVQSLLEAGVREIVVKDAHASGFNFLPDRLHPGAMYCGGATRINERFPGLDNTFDGALLIGYHARGLTGKAVRDHTFTSQGWQSLELNGQPIGEIGIDALLFGLYGVPVLLVTGDDKTCREAVQQLGTVLTYETKTGTGRHSALYKAPERVYAELPAVIAESLQSVGRALPYRVEGPYALRKRFLSTDQADSQVYDGIHSLREDGVTALYQDTDLMRLFMRAI
jgi:D-amino peptidase